MKYFEELNKIQLLCVMLLGEKPTIK